MSLIIRWGKQRSVSGMIAKFLQTTPHFDLVPIPPLDLQFSEKDFDNILLSEVRQRIVDLTTIPKEGIKLIYSGAVLRDYDLPLKKYGLKSGHSLTLLGTVAELAAAKMKADAAPTPQQIEAKLMRRIAEILSNSEAQASKVDEFENTIIESVTTESSATTVAALRKNHLLLSEKFMQDIIKLDAVVPDAQFTVAKQSKKAAINKIQSLLDRLDQAAGSIDSIEVENE